MNNRGRLVVDVLIALVVAVLTLILAGLGLTAIIVGIVLIVCALSVGVGAIVRRRRGEPVRHRARGTRSR